MHQWLVCFFSIAFFVASAGAREKPPFEKVRKVILTAIKDGAFPSAVVAIMKDDRVLFHDAFGSFTYDKHSTKTDTNAIYDMASLTKVLATTMCVMKLYDDGKLRLEDSLTKFIPEFGKRGKAGITIKHLLLHNSGLVAFRQYEKFCDNRAQMLAHIFNDTLRAPIGDTTIYSDVNFILLGELIERISGKALDQFYKETFVDPLGLKSTMFNPPESLYVRIPPVEADSLWRFQWKRPRVHDPRAALAEGVAGHAGLFSSSSDILVLARLMLNGGIVNGKRMIKPQTIALFTQRDSEKSTRALGWDTRSAKESSAGELLSMRSFGHTGYTGTSIWIDPNRSLAVVFLTNRVYPTSANIKIRKVRQLLHNAVIESLNELK
jgi:CubicO group peptidase (beta-lactamase class C family)